MLEANTGTLEFLLTLNLLTDVIPDFGHTIFTHSENIILAWRGYNVIDRALVEVLDLSTISGLLIELDNVSFLVLDEPLALGTFSHTHDVGRSLLLALWSGSHQHLLQGSDGKVETFLSLSRVDKLLIPPLDVAVLTSRHKILTITQQHLDPTSVHLDLILEVEHQLCLYELSLTNNEYSFKVPEMTLSSGSSWTVATSESSSE